MNLEFADPELWLTLAVGMASVGLFLYWLRTGARKPR